MVEGDRHLVDTVPVEIAEHAREPNGKDDDCDGTPNGCVLTGTVEAEWAPVRLVLGEGDWLGDDLDAGDVDGDGWVDLYTPAWLSGSPGALAAGFRGPFVTDTPVAAAYADYGCSRATWLEDLRLLDDLDGDGHGEVAVRYSISSPQPPPPWFYYSWSWMELYSGAPGSVRACDSGSDGPDVWDVVTGRFEDDRAMLVASCIDVTGWCGYLLLSHPDPP